MNLLINRIILLLYILINTLFVEKYVSRVTSLHWLFAIVYILGVVCLLWAIRHFSPKCKHPFKWFLALLILFTGIACILQLSIDPLSLNVDRWSAIHNFLSGMFCGQYPYGQQTHLGGYGSPFPVWQILHIPFYALGNVGMSIIIVTLLFLWTLNRLYSPKVAFVVGILLCISPAFWYEIAVRSDLITNMMLSAIITEWLVHKNVKLINNVVGIALLVGLTLSTRLIAVIPLCVLYGYEFLQLNWKKQGLFLLIILGTFTLTILPFVFWQGSTLLFFEYNPFVLQTRQGSFLVLLIFACGAIGITIWMHGRMNYRTIITGLLLTSLVAMAFVEKMWKENLWTELFSSTFDITYLSVALPFYILHLSLSLTKRQSTLVSNS